MCILVTTLRLLTGLYEQFSGIMLVMSKSIILTSKKDILEHWNDETGWREMAKSSTYFQVYFHI